MTDSKAAQIANQADRGLTDISIIMMRIELAMNDPENAPGTYRLRYPLPKKLLTEQNTFFKRPPKNPKTKKSFSSQQKTAVSQIVIRPFSSFLFNEKTAPNATLLRWGLSPR